MIAKLAKQGRINLGCASLIRSRLGINLISRSGLGIETEGSLLNEVQIEANFICVANLQYILFGGQID